MEQRAVVVVDVRRFVRQWECCISPTTTTAGIMDATRTESSSLAVLHETIETSEIYNKELWVFAYGSLCWKPGFTFQKAVVGHVKGYSRKFWQGNTTHRGTEENVNVIIIFFISVQCQICLQPGRVATLVEEQKVSFISIKIGLRKTRHTFTATNRYLRFVSNLLFVKRVESMV